MASKVTSDPTFLSTACISKVLQKQGGVASRSKDTIEKGYPVLLSIQKDGAHTRS